jgi:peptidoglycan hydrolase-like protein with peptidoglycan-binding domain
MESGKLSIGDFGDDVTRLHETLNSQGLEASPEEVKRKFFGPSTREAVGEFQKANGIDPTGEICNKTAALLSSPLSTSSAVSPDISLTPSTSPSLGVGSLSSQAGLAQPISQTSSRTPSVTGKTVSGAETNQYKVKGHILLENGLPAQELTIRVYNRGFGGVDTPLGEVKTDDQGFYTLPYQLKGSAANFEVRAINAQGQEITLSDPKFGAAKEEVLNLVAPASIQPLAPEYQRLAADLERELDGLSRLAETQENGDRQDLTLLHQATGWDARLIALTASAVKLSADTGIPQEALYALFRVGLPTDKDKLADLSEQTVTQAIAKARASGIVSLTDEQVAQTTAALKVFARQSRRAAIAPGALSSMGTLLSKSGLDLTEQAIFEDFHFAYQGAELWQQIKTDGRIAPEKVNTLQLQGKLAYLTLNNANLTESLQQELQSPNNLAQLADKDLHRADSWKTRLNALAGNNEQTLATLIPPSYGGEKIGDRVDAYAADLARKVRLTFPTQVVRRTIENDELTLGERHSDLKAPVLVFLENAQPLGFELGRTPIAAFIQQNQTVLNGIESSQVQNATEGIKLLQRLYQITPTDESLKVLMSQGFTSAQDVVAFPYETFLDRFGKFFPSVDEARLTYRKSEQVTTTTFNFFTAAKQLDSAPATFVTSSSMPIREAAKNELIKHYPTMEALFGSLDFCECEHCRSVLSPAAYFVELLDFLDYKVDLTKSHQSEQQVWQNFLQDWRAKHGTATYPFKNPTEQTNFLTKWRSNHPGQPDPKTEKTPYEVLIERRPDLPNLPLTCENTQTALPYIDIVNEILEYYVANDRLDVDSGHDTGLATTPELLAEPQNVLAAAYTKLQAAKYPLTLPLSILKHRLPMFWKFCVRQMNYFPRQPIPNFITAAQFGLNPWVFHKLNIIFSPTSIDLNGMSYMAIQLQLMPLPLPKMKMDDGSISIQRKLWRSG